MKAIRDERKVHELDQVDPIASAYTERGLGDDAKATQDERKARDLGE